MLYTIYATYHVGADPEKPMVSPSVRRVVCKDCICEILKDKRIVLRYAVIAEDEDLERHQECEDCFGDR